MLIDCEWSSQLMPGWRFCMCESGPLRQHCVWKISESINCKARYQHHRDAGKATCSVGRPQEITLTFFHKWIGSKLDSYINWLKEKLLNCQARALHGFYELPWFMFPGEGSEQESFPPLLKSSWRITHWCIRTWGIINNNGTKGQIEHLNPKYKFLISGSDYQACHVVLLHQLDFSAILNVISSVSLGITKDTK